MSIFKKEKKSFLLFVSQNTMRRHENPPTIINKWTFTNSFLVSWTLVTFKFPFPLSRCQLFNQVFFEKSTPRHATSVTSISTNLHEFHRRNFTRVAACSSLSWTRVNTRNSKPAHSRNHANNSAIFQLSTQVIVPSILLHGERSFVDATALSIASNQSLVRSISILAPCTVNLYRPGIEGIASQFFYIRNLVFECNLSFSTGLVSLQVDRLFAMILWILTIHDIVHDILLLLTCSLFDIFTRVLDNV